MISVKIKQRRGRLEERLFAVPVRNGTRKFGRQIEHWDEFLGIGAASSEAGYGHAECVDPPFIIDVRSFAG